MSAPARPAPRRGLYDDPFWDHVDRRDLRLQKCTDDGTFRYPPGPACPTCLSLDWSWEPVSGHGSVLSWVVFHRQYFPEFPPPHVVVAGELAEGPILIADLAGELPPEMSAGTPLRIRYDAATDPDGRERTIFRWEIGPA
ncbi:Zn-ribbon domain-containing OB-fold protein [Pseudonocardia lacus]|uniref:Zn-ribbon domain-containing OB-fold protein n=1 Tax=Pseudonocardia lacus TaxID=2835865 RepID=UPI001BDD4924|nr:OB-fold domain-containing protein [Pseudonocardia lacus]